MFALGETHPEEAVYVLGEDGVTTDGSQELVPQQSSISHCVCIDIRIIDRDTCI